jgi:amidase
MPFDTLWVEGPMGRCVSDVALMLDPGVGYEIDDPFSFEDPETFFVQELEYDRLPKHVAFSPNLGVVHMDREVASICQTAASRFRDLGAEITNEAPDFTGALDVYLKGIARWDATRWSP